MIDLKEIAKEIYRVAVYDEPDLADIEPPGVSTNLFLVKAAQPTIINTLPRRAFQRVRDKVLQVVDPATLRYIVVPHHEADSSGALNQWLAAAPRAAAVCSEMCAFLSLNDHSDKKPRPMKDGEVLELGGHRLRFLATPMVNQWDSLMVYEESTRTLFPNDLFSALGTHVASDQDLSRENLEGARVVGYQADDRTALGRALDKIQRLQLQRIAPMHGPVITAHFDKYISAFRDNSVATASERSALIGGP